MNITDAKDEYTKHYASCEKNYLLLITFFARRMKAGNNEAIRGYANACRAYGYLAQNKKLTLTDLVFIKKTTEEAIKLLCSKK